MRARLAVFVSLFALLPPGSALVSAHEAGTTKVKAVLGPDKTYAVEIVTDATALVEKLEIVSGRQPGADVTPARLQRVLADSDAIFRSRLRLNVGWSPHSGDGNVGRRPRSGAGTLDAIDLRPSIEYRVVPSEDPSQPPSAEIRLAGELPEGAERLTWRYGWTFTTYAFVVSYGESLPVTQWLEGGTDSEPISLSAPAAPPSRLATGWRYVTLGFTHILPFGLDHVLFVLGLFLLSGNVRTVLWQASAFTVAHSITLGLSMFGLISAPPSIVEPLIALSIVYIAVENLFLSELKSWRLVLVFAFGLLHGLGFAGVLQELGLPRTEFLTALLTFNIGVEAGQFAVIAAAFLLVGWQRERAWYRRRIVMPASLLIACTAAYWTFERLA
jgi:hypothetical protein